MIYKNGKKDLIKEGLIKYCPVDDKAVDTLIRRALIDIKTAQRNITDDEECSYNYAYNAMLRSGLALMLSDGFRPEVREKHLTIVKYVSSVLGKEYQKLVNSYDFMRRKRHRFIYEPDIPCSTTEASEAFKIAEEFVGVVVKLIKAKNPQFEIDFK